MIQASYSGFVQSYTTLYTRLAMCNADQPAERMLMSPLSLMGCCHCTLPTKSEITMHRRREMPTSRRLVWSRPHLMRTLYVRPSCGLHSIPNTEVQRSSQRYPTRDPTVTVGHQSALVCQAIYRHWTASEVSVARRHLIAHSAHQLPPVLARFVGIESPHCNLYKVITFEKLHVLDLGITRHFCDLFSTIIKKHTCNNNNT